MRDLTQKAGVFGDFYVYFYSVNAGMTGIARILFNTLWVTLVPSNH